MDEKSVQGNGDKILDLPLSICTFPVIGWSLFLSRYIQMPCRVHPMARRLHKFHCTTIPFFFFLYFDLMADFNLFIFTIRESKFITRHNLAGTDHLCELPKCCSDQVDLLLKVIKLLGVEKGKKNKTNLVFLVGNRVLKSIEQSHSTEKALTSLLK